VSRLLQPISRQIHCAENGQVAVNMVQESLVRRDPYDVVLIDYNMPVMNGCDAIIDMRAIRYDGFVVGVTAGGNEEVRSEQQNLQMCYLSVSSVL
jgi:CheY-like chemotaxis protein